MGYCKVCPLCGLVTRCQPQSQHFTITFQGNFKRNVIDIHEEGSKVQKLLTKKVFKKKQTCSHPQLSRALGSIMAILALSLLGKTKTNKRKRYDSKKNNDENNNTNLKSKRLASTDGSPGFPSCLWQSSSSWFWTWHRSHFGTNRSEKEEGRLSPPGGAAAIDEEVDRGVDPQEKVVRTRQAEKIGWRGEKPEKERNWEKIRLRTFRTWSGSRPWRARQWWGWPWASWRWFHHHHHHHHHDHLGTWQMESTPTTQDNTRARFVSWRPFFPDRMWVFL